MGIPGDFVSGLTRVPGYLGGPIRTTLLVNCRGGPIDPERVCSIDIVTQFNGKIENLIKLGIFIKIIFET